MILFDILHHALAGQNEHRVDAGVHAAGNVGIQPVTDEARLLFCAAELLHCRQRHLGLGLSDDFGLSAGGGKEHLDDAAAVGGAAVPSGADHVGVRGDIVKPPAKQNAARLELFIRQLRVVAEQHGGDIVPQPVRHRKTRRAQLLFERFGAADVVHRVLIRLLEV